MSNIEKVLIEDDVSFQAAIDRFLCIFYDLTVSTSINEARNYLYDSNKCMSIGANDYVLKSDNTVQELLIKIPFALNSVRLQKTIRLLETSPSLQLPFLDKDLTPDHYAKYMILAEKEYLISALKLCNGDVSKLSRKISLSRATIFKKMTTFGIEKRTWIHRKSSSLSIKKNEFDSYIGINNQH